MKVWIDADACPVAVSDLINRAAHKLAIEAVYVANKRLQLPVSPYISSVVVASGADVADQYIADNALENDIVVTHDIPLASKLVPLGVTVISPRGDLFDEGNISERLASRDLMQSLRDSGTISGGPAPFTEKDKRNFASRFDAAIQRLRRKTGS
jgi:uncharacterized protein